MVLDDFLSAQGEVTASQLVTSLLSPGGLLKDGATVIVGTSEPSLCPFLFVLLHVKLHLLTKQLVLIIPLCDQVFSISQLGYLHKTSKWRAISDYELEHDAQHPTDNARQQDAGLESTESISQQMIRDIQQTKPIPQTLEHATWSYYLQGVDWPMLGLAICLNALGSFVENIYGKIPSACDILCLANG